MITALYRAAVLALLYKLLEQQRETQCQLRTLRVLAEHPHLVLVTSTNPLSLPSPASSSGVTLKQPSTSFSASRSTTTPTTTTTASTEASGRSAETSGETGEDFSLQGAPRWRAEYSKTSWPTPDTEPEAGSPGPAPTSSVFGEPRPSPEHNHALAYPCTVDCPALPSVQAEKEAAGRHKHTFDQFDRTANTVKCRCGTTEEEAVQRAQQDGVW